jgi:hypothetical protein
MAKIMSAGTDGDVDEMLALINVTADLGPVAFIAVGVGGEFQPVTVSHNGCDGVGEVCRDRWS